MVLNTSEKINYLFKDRKINTSKKEKKSKKFEND